MISPNALFDFPNILKLQQHWNKIIRHGFAKWCTRYMHVDLEVKFCIQNGSDLNMSRQA